MSYNDNLILRYLYGLDNRDYPQSIKRYFSNVNNSMNEDREAAINVL